jgi:hypothetical protein
MESIANFETLSQHLENSLVAASLHSSRDPEQRKSCLLGSEDCDGLIKFKAFKKTDSRRDSRARNRARKPVGP